MLFMTISSGSFRRLKYGTARGHAVGYQPARGREGAAGTHPPRRKAPSRFRRCTSRLTIHRSGAGTTFAHLDATGAGAFDRRVGIYPRCPLASTSRPRAGNHRRKHNVARRVQKVLQRFKDLQDIIAILAWTSWRRTTRRVPRADSAVPQPFSSARFKPRRPAVAAADTVRGFKEILDGSTTMCLRTTSI